jgi:hypothetical protein
MKQVREAVYKCPSCDWGWLYPAMVNYCCDQCDYYMLSEPCSTMFECRYELMDDIWTEGLKDYYKND